ncbi:MAG: Hsp70 family protein [Deltaproteobacteria bacterium]|nr:Hsp70 family protein [Deltaproteobacteria bacterium]
MARYVIGIDLGTTNSAVAYADTREVQDRGRPLIKLFEIPQLSGPGSVQSRGLLPSALYRPAKFELGDGRIDLPWETEEEKASGKQRFVVGEAARKLGAKTPVRLVESAKSWLCHGGVNRTAAILPWHAPEDVPKLSPVDVCASYLAHVQRAWDYELAKADPTLAFKDQDVIVTVPASFDEVARQLTLEAAKRAGVPNVTLIEEPLAAFYDFIARTGGTAEATGLSPGERVLVADVGGGTTDFTLVDVGASDEKTGVLTFERTAVGDHLLLGGDNMDLALAHAVEPELTKGTKKLDAEGWAQLKFECRLAKEALFTELSQDHVPVVVTGRGSKLIGGTLRADMTRELLDRVVLEGYFPPLPKGEAARPQRVTRTGFLEYGLPYASDPAITRHMAAFLLRHAGHGEPAARVHAVLFNGGALIPSKVRDRILRVLGDWLTESGVSEQRPRPLIYDQGEETLSLAVARGAAYFGLVRAGLGVRVGGGAPREYFVEIASDGGSLPPGKVRVLCVAPRGMQDGQTLEVSSRDFMLVTNKPVEFPIYTSTGPEGHPVGAILDLDKDGLVRLPALQTVVRFGKHQAGTEVPVRLQARRTELGTLELSCFSRMSGARFRLEFDLRGSERDEPAHRVPPSHASRLSLPPMPIPGAGASAPPDAGEVDPRKLAAARSRVSETFKVDPPRLDSDLLMKGLEEDLGVRRDEVPIGTLRNLAEHLLELMDARSISSELEARWLNVAGFCLRPGSGYPLDDWRVRQLWKIHGPGLAFPGRDPCELNWWILWRRVAAGLQRGHQLELSAILWPLLVPSLAKKARRKPPKSGTQEAVEMWRTASALERVDAKQRAQLGDALMELIEARKAPKSALWCLSRIGARRPLYGPREATIRPEIVSGWVLRLIKLDKPPKDERPKDYLISLARLVGDRQFDLDEPTRLQVMGYLATHHVPEKEIQPLREVIALDAESESVAFGEGLPTGLRLGAGP